MSYTTEIQIIFETPHVRTSMSSISTVSQEEADKTLIVKLFDYADALRLAREVLAEDMKNG